MKTISKQFWEDQQWGFQHHSELLSKYRDKWVAIANRKVVSSGGDLGKVREEARRITHQREIPVFFVECG